MPPLTRRCRITGESFVVEDDDLAFYEKMGVPIPTVAPMERTRQMLATANHKNLFQRTCAATGKKIVTYYPPESPVPIYDIAYWWSDKWDQFANGREFDFSRPFFEQFAELMLTAPRPSMHRGFEFDLNSDYTNYAGHNKNCYFIFDSDHSQDCYYSFSINSCIDCGDCFRVESSELCYECVNCGSCYGSKYLQNCQNCSDSWFLKNCIGCAECCFCVNLKNKRYCFENRQLSEQEYRRIISGLGLSRRSKIKALEQRFSEYSSRFPLRATEGTFNEDSTGDYLSNCKNARYCFDSRKLWDCKYFVQAFEEARDCMDCVEIGGETELCYYSSYSGTPAYFVRFSSHSYPHAQHQTYCYFTPNSSHVFGCAGVHHAQFTILNRRYPEAEYNRLVSKIIEHMKSTGEWGEYFPPALSPFPYNISTAHEYMPLAREQALKLGYGWREDDASEYQAATSAPPEEIFSTPDDVTKEIFACAVSGRNYRLQKAELALYRKLSLPIPDRCFDRRHAERQSKRNKRRIYERKCAECGSVILTTVPPENPAPVLCERDFQNALT